MIQISPWEMVLDLIKAMWMVVKFLWPLFLLVILVEIIKNIPRWIMNKRVRAAGLDKVDSMSGEKFEIWLEHQFKKDGYEVQRTRLQGDHGADLILTSSEGTKTAVQAKQLSKRKDRVGAKALGEVLRGKKYYKCDEAMMVTNQSYTQQARDEARRIGIELVDRKKLIEFVEKVNSNSKK